MANTIADKLEYLEGTKTAIRGAIVAKGVDVPDNTPFREYASKIGAIEGGGGGTVFGVTVSDLIGEVNADGKLNPSGNYVVDLTGVKSIGEMSLYYTFYFNTNILGVVAPDLTRIEQSGMQGTFVSSRLTGEISFPKLAYIGPYGASGSFETVSGITKISLPNLTEVGERGLYNAFSYCGQLTEVDFRSLMKLGPYAMANAFGGVPITTISFPALYSVDRTSFGEAEWDGVFVNCTSLTEIHFAKAAQPQIEAMAGYEYKWGAPNATIYFDL